MVRNGFVGIALRLIGVAVGMHKAAAFDHGTTLLLACVDRRRHHKRRRDQHEKEAQQPGHDPVLHSSAITGIEMDRNP